MTAAAVAAAEAAHIHTVQYRAITSPKWLARGDRLGSLAAEGMPTVAAAVTATPLRPPRGRCRLQGEIEGR